MLRLYYSDAESRSIAENCSNGYIKNPKQTKNQLTNQPTEGTLPMSHWNWS
jgi:hypothetical protein